MENEFLSQKDRDREEILGLINELREQVKSMKLEIDSLKNSVRSLDKRTIGSQTFGPSVLDDPFSPSNIPNSPMKDYTPLTKEEKEKLRKLIADTNKGDL